MEVRRNQNLGFGTLHIRVDKAKLPEKNVKAIDEFLCEFIGNGNYHTAVNSNRLGVVINDLPAREKSIAKILRVIGAKVTRTIKPETIKRSTKQIVNWVYKAHVQ